jgi:hypothetical protein
VAPRNTLRFAALGIALAGAVVVIGVVVADRGGSGPPQVAVPKSPGFPAPPVGAVVFSRQLGGEALALGVVPQQQQMLLQASVLGPEGKGVSRLAVAFAVQGATKQARACGAGCYRATLPTNGRPRAVDVEVRAARWHVALPATWPPPDASTLVARAGRVWRSLHSLAFREHLASDARHAVTSTWRIEEPDRVAYQVRGGAAGVVIGPRRWDRLPGERWKESPQTRLSQPVPAWVSAADAHVLGTATVRGRPAWRISFFDPGTPAWFTVVLDRRTFHTLESHMVATAHFMDDVYGSFDEVPPIRPPR